MIPRRQLGATGLEVSVLGFGGAPIGFAEQSNEPTFVPLLQRAVELGVTFFDTAPDYRRSEEILGGALSGRRHDIVLATKVGRVQTRNGRAWDVREDWSENGVMRMIDESLQRLRTDYLDVVQLHSPPIAVLDDGAAIHGLRRAQGAGKVRYLGISADGTTALRAIELGMFATLQVSYSMLQQEAGDDVLPAAAEHGMGVIVKQPLANAIPTMRGRPDHPDWTWKWDVAERMDWSGLDIPEGRLALALRWLLANPLVGTAIAGTSRLEHLEANAAAAMTPPLDPSAVRRINDEYFSARRQLEGRTP